MADTEQVSPRDVETRNVVVVGASAGGVEALRTFVAGLSEDFPAAVLVVLHVPPVGSALPQILRRAGTLPVKHAEEGDPLRTGEVLVAPPDRHLVIVDGHVTLTRGPRENGHRPAIDVLFRSAARALGPRVVAVVLSGALDDGAAGMVAVRLRGGRCVVQDPEEALHASMPLAALRSARLEHGTPVAKMPEVLLELIGKPVDEAPAPSEIMDQEVAVAEFDIDELNDPDRPGRPAGLSCPDCHGSLFEIAEGGLVRYRCRIGHAWSPESLAAQQAVGLESALWMALRSLEEKAALALDLSAKADLGGHRLSAENFERSADEALEAAKLLRELIERVTGATPPEVEGVSDQE